MEMGRIGNEKTLKESEFWKKRGHSQRSNRIGSEVVGEGKLPISELIILREDWVRKGLVWVFKGSTFK